MLKEKIILEFDQEYVIARTIGYSELPRILFCNSRIQHKIVKALLV